MESSPGQLHLQPLVWGVNGGSALMMEWQGLVIGPECWTSAGPNPLRSWSGVFPDLGRDPNWFFDIKLVLGIVTSCVSLRQGGDGGTDIEQGLCTQLA